MVSALHLIAQDGAIVLYVLLPLVSLPAPVFLIILEWNVLRAGEVAWSAAVVACTLWALATLRPIVFDSEHRTQHLLLPVVALTSTYTLPLISAFIRDVASGTLHLDTPMQVAVLGSAALAPGAMVYFSAGLASWTRRYRSCPPAPSS